MFQSSHRTARRSVTAALAATLATVAAIAAGPVDAGQPQRDKPTGPGLTVADGTDLVPDARLGGVAVAVVALLLRAPFIVVVALAAATAALFRLLG